MEPISILLIPMKLLSNWILSSAHCGSKNIANWLFFVQANNTKEVQQGEKAEVDALNPYVPPLAPVFFLLAIQPPALVFRFSLAMPQLVIQDHGTGAFQVAYQPHPKNKTLWFITKARANMTLLWRFLQVSRLSPLPWKNL